jgi:hypothetical protein
MLELHACPLFGLYSTRTNKVPEWMLLFGSNPLCRRKMASCPRCLLWVTLYAFSSARAFTLPSRTSRVVRRITSRVYASAVELTTTPGASSLGLSAWAVEAAADDLTREGSAALPIAAAENEPRGASSIGDAADRFPGRLLSLSPDEITALLGGSGRAKVPSSCKFKLARITRK